MADILQYNPRDFSSVTTEAGMGTDELALLRLHLHLENNADNNTLLEQYRNAARGSIEAATGKVLLNETWEWAIDGQPGTDVVYLPKEPLVSITSVTSYDTAGNATTFAASNYTVDKEGNRFFLKEDGVWPSDLRNYRSLVISYVAGYGEAITDLPSLMRQALLLYVGHLWEFREEADMPKSVRKLIAPLMDIEQ